MQQLSRTQQLGTGTAHIQELGPKLGGTLVAPCGAHVLTQHRASNGSQREPPTLERVLVAVADGEQLQ
eukprot:8854447-Pyramimonas_sp.AAC.1